jgi:predicted amidohydrolase
MSRHEDGKHLSSPLSWDRDGKRVGRYRISQYGGSRELPVRETDFGVIGLMLCGDDIYSQEICRAMVLQGVEIIFCGSQSWGASGTSNRWMNQVRAIDNADYLANAHFPFSDIGQQSYVIDPYGQILAGTPYAQEAVITTEVDLDAGQTWFARSSTPG